MNNSIPQIKQRGMMLIEGLIAILIFSLGILSIVSMQAASIKGSADSKYRADASLLANQIIGQMWVDQGLASINLTNYAHNPVAGATACTPGGAPSGNVNVTAWLADVAATLPGATAANQQIIITPLTNVVTVTICWQAPQDTGPHNFVTSAQINL